MQMTRSAKPRIGDPGLMGVAGPAGGAARAVSGPGVPGGAKAEPAAFVYLGVVMQLAGAVSYNDEGDRR